MGVLLIYVGVARDNGWRVAKEGFTGATRDYKARYLKKRVSSGVSVGSRASEDLSGSPVAHALLRGSLVGAHLKANHVLARLELVIAEIPLVFLGFPAMGHGKCSQHIIISYDYKTKKNLIYCNIIVISSMNSFFRLCFFGRSLEEPAGVSLVGSLVLSDGHAAQS